MNLFENIPLLIVTSLKNDLYSKPYSTLYHNIIKNYLDIKKIDIKKSFFVGEFIIKNKKKSLSYININFAYNIGIKYFHGNKYFNDEDIILENLI